MNVENPDYKLTYFYFADMNPGTQGASLTEGKRTRRSKAKQNGDAGQEGRSGSPKSDEEPGELINPPSGKTVTINFKLLCVI